MTDTVRAFDLLSELPSGTTVLEASAGTGKTFAIVGLALRFVAEGVADISELLLVTFSRTATRELKERARQRFSGAVIELGDIERARFSEDEVIRLLASGDESEVEKRRQRLVHALSEFDSATIATTHSFCQQMLDGLGISGEREQGVAVVESIDDLAAEVFDDLYLQRYSRQDSPPFTISEARSIGKAAVTDRHAHLAPAADVGGDSGERVRFADAARAEIEKRKKVARIRDFDDLVVLLHSVLGHPELGAAACRRLRDRFTVVLVDEFQDTDPIQWDILRRAFHGETTLVLVGDPKQAIYAFRGAEVLSYIDAVRVADHHRELTVNWRSDAALLAALDHLYGGVALGHPDITVHQVIAHHPISRLSAGAPCRLRYLPRRGSGALGGSGFPAVGALRARVAADVAADIVRLLKSGAELAIDSVSRPVQPGDVAVLARTRAQASLVRDALDDLGVPSVLAGGTSVFATESASEWLWVLQALEQPHRSDRVRLAASTSLLGWTAADIASQRDDVVSEVGGRLRELATTLAVSGFAAVFDRICAHTSLETRLLGARSGERRITDLRHVAQLLNKAAVDESLGLSALARWLGERIAEPSSGAADRSRRLDSDAAAVQILTVHASKGLEFPIVYLPFAWDAAKNPKQATFLLHDSDGNRTLDVGGPSAPGVAARKRLHDAEDAGEELRLLYVSLTRAMCQVVLWWAPSASVSVSALHRVIGSKARGGRTMDALAPKIAVPDDDAVDAWFAAWSDGATDVISLERVLRDGEHGAVFSPPSEAEAELECARAQRRVDTAWRRTSYSALTRSVHDPGPHESVGVRSEVEEPGLLDEPEEHVSDFAPPAHSSAELQAASIPSPMNGLPAGPAFGSLVHEVLEQIDTDAPDLRVELLACCAETVSAHLADVEPAVLAAALFDVLTTPVRPDGLALAQIRPRDRLAEMDFELPLAGGEDPVATEVTLQKIADLISGHLPSNDPLADYPHRLASLGTGALRGYLTGSIDAVLRTVSDDGDAEYVVVDYKTNRLIAGDLTVGHFSEAAMAREMMVAHYPLQALLYAVALHRYLRWRHPRYSPARHLGGVKYLFVRGMGGAHAPAGYGVFDWRPPSNLVVALSDLLAGNVGDAS